MFSSESRQRLKLPEMARVPVLSPEMKQKSYASDYEPVTRSPRARTWESEPEEAWLPRSSNNSSLDMQDEVEEAEAPLPRPTSTRRKAQRSTQPSLLKRGHAIAYAGLFLYIAAVYFRPYEFSESLAWSINISFYFAIFTLLAFIPSQLASEGTLTARTPEVNYVLLLCLLAFLSIPLAISPGNSFAYFTNTYIKIVLMFIVMVNVLRTERRLKGLLFLSLLVGCVMSASALYDYRTGDFAVEGYRVTSSIGVHGLFGNPDDMALHFVIMFPIAVGLMFKSRSLFHKALFAGCALLMVMGILVSFSRGCFLGFVTILAFLFWRLGRRNKSLVAVLFLVSTGAFLLLAPGGFLIRILSIFDHSLDPVGSATARSAVVLRSILVTLRNPLLGVGIDNFPIMSIRNMVTHNSYTQVSSELGLPALAVYVMLIVTAIRRLGRVARETYEERSRRRLHYLAIGVQASLIGYMVSSAFYAVAFNWHVYYLAGYAVCLWRLNESEKARTGDKKKALDPAVGDDPVAAAAAVAQRLSPATIVR